MAIGTRLRIARKYARLTQAELSEKSGVKQAMISKLETNKSRETSSIVPLAVACGVRPEWLHYGDGPMVGDSSEASPAQPAPKEAATDTDRELYKPRVQHEADLIGAYRALDEDAKDFLWGSISREASRIANNPLLALLLKRVSRGDRQKQDRELELAQKRHKGADNKSSKHPPSDARGGRNKSKRVA